MNISYDLLKTFLIFNQSKNIYEASKSLGITQPAVSNHLKAVETYFDRPLFKLKGKKKILNTAGTELQKSLESKFGLIDKAITNFQQKNYDIENMNIRIAARQEVLNQISSFVRFKGSVSFQALESPQVIQAISKGKIDFGVARDVPTSKEVGHKTLGEITLCFLIHKNLLNDKRPTLSLFKNIDFLESAPFYSFGDKMPHMNEWCEHIRFSSERINLKASICDWESVVKMVETNEGYTLCPSTYDSSSSNLIKIDIPKNLIPSLKFHLLFLKENEEIFPINTCFNMKLFKTV